MDTITACAFPSFTTDEVCPRPTLSTGGNPSTWSREVSLGTRDGAACSGWARWAPNDGRECDPDHDTVTYRCR